MNMNEILERAPRNANIQHTLMILNVKLELSRKTLCSVSGGSDSDVLIDLIEQVKPCVRGGTDVSYVFFDTGLEYEATHRHLAYLEKKYNIKIDRYKAIEPIPIACKKHGMPFLSKQISEHISRLQKYEFVWKDQSFEELCQEYPDCKSSLRWWCNTKGEESRFNISANKWLKEFIIENPPAIPVSEQCCKWAKKKTSHQCDLEYEPDLRITGVRQAEGGVRVAAYDTCFSPAADDGIAEYRPLFFWSDKDKSVYKEHYGLINSDCYEVYGLSRTGCAGCPFSGKFEDELQVIHDHEPKLEAAVYSIFGPSYEYTRRYREYKARREKEEKQDKQQTRLEGVW